MTATINRGAAFFRGAALRRSAVALMLVFAVGACSASSGATGKPSSSAANGQEKGAPAAAVDSHTSTTPQFGGPEPAVAPGAQTGSGASGNGTSGTSGASSGSSGVAIAYPYPYGGSLGAAPEHTIMAGASASADMKADSSNKAAAEQKAFGEAFAEAKQQATAAAAAMGVQLDGTYSVSVSATAQLSYPATGCIVPPAAPAESGQPQVDPATTKCEAPSARPTGGQVYVTVAVAFNFK